MEEIFGDDVYQGLDGTVTPTHSAGQFVTIVVSYIWHTICEDILSGQSLDNSSERKTKVQIKDDVASKRFSKKRLMSDLEILHGL